MANAVLDGVDGIMLGAETLRGSYPVQTVQTVLSIARSAEAVFDYSQHFESLMASALEVQAPDMRSPCACMRVLTRTSPGIDTSCKKPDEQQGFARKNRHAKVCHAQ